MDMDQNDVFWKIQSVNEDMQREVYDSPSSSLAHYMPSMDYSRLSPMPYDPSTFTNDFVLPRFASQGPQGKYGYDVAIAEPSRSSPSSSKQQDYDPPKPSSRHSAYVSGGPIYAPYGSSIVRLDNSASTISSASRPPPSTYPSDFDPASLDLPIPPAVPTNFAGLYSSSGFDLLGVLARVASRPNQGIQIGPVDTSCSFLVVDARKYDFPIVFASETFSRMTGYSNTEVVGKNCRFLQSPNGTTEPGTTRKYTDSNAVWHMKTHIDSGKESQSSLINYCKSGRPFINLVTIIPISWDDPAEIAYYVGFQVDLVDQPNAILDRMKDGSYVVNYSLLSQPPKTVSMRSIAISDPEESWALDDVGMQDVPEETVLETRISKGGEAEALQKLQLRGLGGLVTEDERRNLHTLLFNNQFGDFVHVLSLKGSILYCSKNANQILEYDPRELVGSTIQSFCHPSDVVPIMRELKDAGGVPDTKVNLLYRIRRKHSGYIWVEAAGKLHIEPGKGRKSIILIGRPRLPYAMSWQSLRQNGGIGEGEFWMKISRDGMVLYATGAVREVLGFGARDLAGSSMYQLVPSVQASAVENALRQCRAGISSQLRHSIKARKGNTDVVTYFYCSVGAGNEEPATHTSVITQTILASTVKHKNEAFKHVAPSYQQTSPRGSLSPESTPSSDPSSSLEQSVFKNITHPSTTSDNVFDELDTTRCTSWQYELHQLQILNKKLKDEKEQLKETHAPPSFIAATSDRGPRRGTSDSSSHASSSRGARGCGNCGRADSHEWVVGPGGAKLCSLCGHRYRKILASGM